VKDFTVNLLDFKKQRLHATNFKTLQDYRESNGLHLNLQPVFFLHLIKKLNKEMSSPTVTTSSSFKRLSLTPSTSPVSTTPKPLVQQPTKSLLPSSNQNYEKVTNSSNTSNTRIVQVQNVAKKPSPVLAGNQKTSLRKRSRSSSSSDSTVSSSCSIASSKNARKLEKQLNNRIAKYKSSSALDKNEATILNREKVSAPKKKTRQNSISSVSSEEFPVTTKKTKSPLLPTPKSSPIVDQAPPAKVPQTLINTQKTTAEPQSMIYLFICIRCVQ
jgi:hypothetical protein